MAGSVVKPPRRVGSFKLLQRTAETQGNTGGGSGMSSQSTSGGTAPVPNSAPPGMINPQNPQTSNAWLAWNNSNNQNNYNNNKYEDKLRGRITTENVVKNRSEPMEAWRNITPQEKQPQYTANAQAPVQASWMERPAVGGGMVRGRGDAPSRADRMGVEVTSAGGTPIRIDNNDAIKGQATAEQAQEIRTTNQNSVDYNQYKDYEAIGKQSGEYATQWDRLSRAAIDPNATPEQREKAANDLKLLESDMKYYGEQSDRAGQGLAAEKAKYEPGVNQYRGEVDAAAKQKAETEATAAATSQQQVANKNTIDTIKNKLNNELLHNYGTLENPNVYRNTDPNLVARRVNEISDLVGTLGDGSIKAFIMQARAVELLQDIQTSDDDNLVNRRRNELNSLLDELGAMTPKPSGASTTSPTGSGSGVTTSSAGLAPTGQSQQSLTSADGQQPTVQSGTIDPISGLSPERHAATRTPGRDAYGDPRYNENIGGMTANDVAEAYNIPPDQALYYLKNGATFRPDGQAMVVNGVTYDGSEIFDALSGNTVDPENAKGGQALRTGWVNQVTEEGNRSRLAAEQAGLDDAQKRVEAELNKPLDLRALTQGFDRTIAAQKQSAARNKALALKAQMEQGAESGSSVNQMMGMATETGYGYDTEAQMQATALNLQKEMEIVKATKEDASRKLSWAINLYNNAKTDQDRAKYWALKTQQDEVLRQNQIHEANIAAAANDPGIGAYLAAAGIGVAGAVGSIFSGGATGVAAAGAITSLLGAGASMYGMSQGGGGQMPGPANFNYQGPPGSGTPLRDSSNMYYTAGGAPGGNYMPNNIAPGTRPGSLIIQGG